MGVGRPFLDLRGDSASGVAVKVALTRSVPLAALGDSLAVRRGLAIKSGEGAAWSGRRWCDRGGPELGGAAGGRDLAAGCAAGKRERVERALDVGCWPVVLQGV